MLHKNSLKIRIQSILPSHPSRFHHRLQCQNRCKLPQVVHAPLSHLKASYRWIARRIPLTEAWVVWVKDEMLDIFLLIIVVALCQFLHFSLLWRRKQLLKGIKEVLFGFILAIFPLDPIQHPFSQLLRQCLHWFLQRVIFNIGIEAITGDQTILVVQGLFRNTALLIQATEWDILQIQ